MADPCTVVLKAAETAARWHADQKSKGSSGAPYINHLLEVASLVAEATSAKDPNLILAALLHDAIEDQEIDRDEIARRFGKDVAALVAEFILNIRTALEDAGATVTATTTVRHALILVEHDGLSGAIMDHALADGDSTELCVRLKAKGVHAAMSATAALIR